MALPEGALLVERRCTMRGTQLGVLLPVMLLLTGCAQSASQPQSWDFFAMDTYMTFKVWSQDPALPERTRTEIERLERMFVFANKEKEIHDEKKQEAEKKVGDLHIGDSVSNAMAELRKRRSTTPSG